MNNKKYIQIAAMILFVLVFGIHSHAQSDTVAPKLVQQLLANRFPQTLVGECDDAGVKSLVQGNTSIRWNDGELSIHGTDDHSNIWNAHLEVSPISECQIWMADLAQDGQHDILILSMGMNSSGGWDSQLILLLKDHDGRPFPWQAVGNFSSDAIGVLQIARSNAAGTAEILVPKQSGYKFSGLSYSYNRFIVSGSRISRITKAKDGSEWPLLQSPTKELKEEADKYDASTQSDLSGSSTNTNNSSATIVRIENPDNMQDEKIALSSGNIISYPKILMIDRSTGERVIDFEPTQNEILQMKNKSDKVITLGTTCDQGDCQTLLLWGKE